MPTLADGTNGPHDAVPPSREVLTVEAAASRQIHRVTVYTYIRGGLPPAARLGKVDRISRTDVDIVVQKLRAQRR